MTSELLTANQVAQLTSFPVGTLAYWRMKGEGPEYVKIGRWVRYRREDIDSWIDAKVVGNRGDV